MPLYVIKPFDQNMSADEAAIIICGFDSTIKIVSEKDSGIEVEMTAQQAGDFLATYSDWRAEKVVYADINKPAPNLDNIRKALQRSGHQPS